MRKKTLAALTFLAVLTLSSAASAQEGFQQPRVYIGFHSLGIESILADSGVPGGASDLDGSEDTRFWVGFETSLDFRLTQRFGLGVWVDYLEPEDGFGDTARVMTGLRFSGLIQIGESLVLHPFGKIGFNGRFYPDCEGCDPRYGYTVAGGFGIKWMFLRWLGFSANFDLGFRNLMWEDEQGRGVDATHVDVGLDLGLTCAF
jgi:hypothetical protein